MVIQPITNILFHHYGEEAVILNLNTERYFSLNEIAIRMWDVLSTTESFESACALIADEYEAPLDVIQADVTVFIKSLQEAGIVEHSQSAPS